MRLAKNILLAAVVWIGVATSSHYGRIDIGPDRPDWLDTCGDRFRDMSIALSERTESQ